MWHRLKLLTLIPALFLFALLGSGCRMTEVLRITPAPLESPTPKLQLNQVTDIPTLPVITPTSTPQIGSYVLYEDPSDIFTRVTSEMLPGRSYDQVVIFGTVDGFTTQTDAWGNTIYSGDLRVSHHSGTEFRVTCDDFCFYTDALRNLIPSDKVTRGSEVIIFGAAGETLTDISADLIAVHTLAEVPEVRFPEMSGLPSGMTYNEYELDSFPQLNPIRISGSSASPVSVPTSTPDPWGYTADTASTYTDNTYSGNYTGYGKPTSTPNRPPTATPTPIPEKTAEPQVIPTQDLNALLQARLTHTLANRSNYTWGAYGERYSVFLEYDHDQNRDPRHPTRADISIESNDYAFTDYWIPYVQNPMYYNWGVVCYGGDWYLTLRSSVDLDPDAEVADLVYNDRTIRSQQNFDAAQGYLRSFGFSIIDSKLFYFYQTENGYGISINRQDFDLGFDDIPFGYVGSYTEIDPFYSDDLITFFGHRGGKWYYVELGKEEPQYGYYW